MMPLVMIAAAGLVGIVLASGPDVVRTGHRYHVKELQMECTRCHASIPHSTSANDQNVAGHDECFVCHDGTTAPDACQTCHTNPDEATTLVIPPREIHFSHEAHVERGATCATCHHQVRVDRFGDPVYGLPGMGECVTCHNGRTAPMACTTCHTRTGKLPPMDHEPGWIQRHGEVARGETEVCAQCHVQEQDCDNCHRGDNLQGIPHQEGFIETHPFIFFSKTKDCGACHDFAASCRPCHESRGVFPANHLPRSVWADPSTGGRHRDFASTDMEFCAACHDEAQPVCVQCHEDGEGD